MTAAPSLERFAYDTDAPLRVVTGAVETRDGVVVEEIRYDRAAGGEAEAYLVAPDGTSPRRAVVIAHGGSSPKKHLFRAEGIELAQRGFLVLVPDTIMPPLGDPAADERAGIAAVCTQRRGLDVLESRGATRFGHFGHSFGGNLGAILGAVEPRLSAVVIAAMGTGLVDWMRRQGIEDEAYLAGADRFDPIHYVPVPGRRRLLFQCGLRDEVIFETQARALYDAAAEPKRWLEYDCDHAVDAFPAARADRMAFLEAEV
jgi:dipeptidyl aminopeptidase/acylaminoacyl peptidase